MSVSDVHACMPFVYLTSLSRTTSCLSQTGARNTPYHIVQSQINPKGPGGGGDRLHFMNQSCQGGVICCCRYVDPVMATGWHMLLGGLPLAALSLAREGSELGPRLQQLTGQHLMLVTQLKST